jgi:lipopolysaccharide export LptBFGC system permease protein LptF
MSPTLFWYIFKDLLKIFLLAAGVLGGIMSFGGLLRPLTEHGLAAGQVVRILGYFMPAMNTYSLPVAALFATTMVYGRLGADNELTACRAAGVSAVSIALPAFALGLLVSAVSFAFLYFIVPICSLQVERVIYSNIAQLVANQVERTHRIEMKQGSRPLTIFAQQAQVLRPPKDRPNDQVVRLVAPVFVNYERPNRRTAAAADKRDDFVQPPSDFYIARLATVYITQDESTGEVSLQAQLDGGAKFPRSYGGGSDPALQVNIEHTRFWSDPMESPVRENTKFMTLARLRELLDAPERSRRVRRLLAEFIRDDQQQAYLRTVASALGAAGGAARFDAGGGEQYLLECGSGGVELREDRLVIGSTSPEAAPSSAPRFRQLGKDGGLDVAARQVQLRAAPEPAGRSDNSDNRPRLAVEVQLVDALVKSGDVQTPRSEFTRSFTVPMSPDIDAIRHTRVRDYIAGGEATSERQNRLRRDLLKLTNSIISETHARASFSVSCLILVLFGCALGMMFHSGNFLGAFALSVLPAALCILLIITGQHTCENVPWNVSNFQNPLGFGITMIWAGNAAVAVLAAVLLGNLQRQ